MSTQTPSSSVATGALSLGPYVSAAATIHGPAQGDLGEHLDRVVRTAVTLASRVDAAHAAAELERPVRSYKVTGILSVSSARNRHRTQIEIDTGQSRYGPDQMWTAFEDEPAAARTRAILTAYVGRRVEAVKQTFYEYDANGEVLVNAKNEKQTRTRLAPGSLFVLDDGERIAIDLNANAPAAEHTVPPAGGAVRSSVSAQTALAWLVDHVGEARAHAAWGDLPRSGDIDRDRFEAARCRVTAETQRPEHETALDRGGRQ